YNEKQLLADARKQRMADAKRRRVETKQRREQLRADKAAAWAERKKRELIYLGEGVSGGLTQRRANRDRLSENGVPVYTSPEALASAMRISLGEMRFLAFDRRVAQVHHYRRFEVPKKTGGTRHISAPMPRLKAAQTWILNQILKRVPVHEAAHGFRHHRSIASNARPHVGADVVINMDLLEFFPTVTYPRVKGMFVALGYSESVATVLTLLCTEPDVEEVDLDGNHYFVAVGPRRLPQGSPASPAITNILCRGLDKRLQGLADSLGFKYTRYADDLTFSGGPDVSRTSLVGRVIRGVEDIVDHEGFIVHPRKTRVMRRTRKLEVTGVTVNDKLGVDRATLRKFRAVLFQIEKDGPKGKHWGHSGNVLTSVVGYANFVAMIDPEKGRPLQRRAKALLAKHGHRPKPPATAQAPAASPPPPPPPAAGKPEPEPEPEQPKKKKRWKLW
ncbi:MAG: reverse transcriptase family protein, partial [Nannocystaceae bacterium]